MTAIPRFGSASVIRTAYQERLARSLAALLDGAEQGLRAADLELPEDLDETLADARSLALSLDVRRRLSPELHAAHATLRADMIRGDAMVVIDDLARLAGLARVVVHEGDDEPPLVEGLPRDPLQLEILREALPEDERSQLHAPADEVVEAGASMIARALQLLVGVDPAMAEEVRVLVGRVSVLGSGPLHGMTDVRAYGRIYVRAPRLDEDPVDHYLEHLVHETSHLRLHAMMAIDPLVRNDPAARFEAPIRADDRPMFGVIHAAYVLSRLVRVFRRLPDSRTRIAARTRFEAQLRRGIATVSAHAELTAMGSQVLASLAASAEGP